MKNATTQQIDAARKAYDDASWQLYYAPIWGRSKHRAKREQLRRALLALDPNHFAKRERAAFEASVNALDLSPEDKAQRIAAYIVSDVAIELDTK